MAEYINYEDAINLITKGREFIDKVSFPYLGACDILSSLPRVELNSSSPIDISKVIREHRIEKQWTQRQLADKAGISRQTTWNVEQNNHGTTVYTFERLLNAMGYELVVAPIEKGANK